MKGYGWGDSRVNRTAPQWHEPLSRMASTSHDDRLGEAAVQRIGCSAAPQRSWWSGQTSQIGRQKATTPVRKHWMGVSYTACWAASSTNVGGTFSARQIATYVWIDQERRSMKPRSTKEARGDSGCKSKNEANSRSWIVTVSVERGTTGHQMGPWRPTRPRRPRIAIRGVG